VKILTTEIDDCFDCSNCDLSSKKGWVCIAKSAKGRLFEIPPDYMDTLPSWCPLPDAPDGEKGEV